MEPVVCRTHKQDHQERVPQALHRRLAALSRLRPWICRMSILHCENAENALSFEGNLTSYSEFPSLSGSSQPQYQNPSQAIWQRNLQQTPVQRPQQQQPHGANSQVSQGPSANQQRQDLSSAQSVEDMFTGSSHLQNSFEDFRQDGQGLGPLTSSRQVPPTNIEDFPPLGRNGTGESESDERNPFGVFSNSTAFSSQANQNQNRQAVIGGPAAQISNARSSSAVDTFGGPSSNEISDTISNKLAATSNSRSPFENGRADSSIATDSDRMVRNAVIYSTRANFLSRA